MLKTYKTIGLTVLEVHSGDWQCLLNHFERLQDPDDLENAQDLHDSQHPRLALQPALVHLSLFSLRHTILQVVEENRGVVSST